jgi:hypothetical protein
MPFLKWSLVAFWRHELAMIVKERALDFRESRHREEIKLFPWIPAVPVVIASLRRLPILLLQALNRTQESVSLYPHWLV